MSATNPPPIRVPQEFAKDRNTFAYFNELHTFLRLLWERTGGGTDVIAGTTDASTLLLPAMSDKAAIGVLSQSIADIERMVASLQSLRGKLAASDLRFNEADAAITAVFDVLFNTLLPAVTATAEAALVLSVTGPDAARYAHLEQRLNDVELLAWL